MSLDFSSSRQAYLLFEFMIYEFPAIILFSNNLNQEFILDKREILLNAWIKVQYRMNPKFSSVDQLIMQCLIHCSQGSLNVVSSESRKQMTIRRRFAILANNACTYFLQIDKTRPRQYLCSKVQHISSSLLRLPQTLHSNILD